jgi:hypothetical protein
MWIMNLVWPIVALFGSLLTLWVYFRYGHSRKDDTPRAIIASKATLHCGAGCTLGDICAEWLAFALPAIAIAFGWQSLFSEKMFVVWIVDFIFCLRLRHFVPVFHYRADARSLAGRGARSGGESRCAVALGVADRHVWLYDLRTIRAVPAVDADQS